MGLKTIVKINGVNNLSDARYCAGMGVEMLGFCLEEGKPNYVSPEKYQEIVGWISGVKFVGEFVDSNLQLMNDILAEYPVHALQVEREYVIAEIHKRTEQFGGTTIAIIYRIDLTNLETDKLPQILAKYKSCVTYYLLEADDDQELSNEMLTVIQELSNHYPLLLGFGISKDNVHGLLEKTKIKGISLRGGEEIRPGLKDFDALAVVLEAIEID